MNKDINIQTYIDVFKRRKAQFVVPAVLVFFLLTVLAFALPSVYKSVGNDSCRSTRNSCGCRAYDGYRLHRTED